MEQILRVENATCIRCGRCVKVCPAWIFAQQAPKADIELHNESSCITCGHCVAACPTDSVIHSGFPEGTVHRIEQSALPSPESVMLLIKNRRSNRAFSSKPIPVEYLEQILEAAHRAPTASNMQQVEFTLVTDPQKLKMITGATIGTFSAAVKKLQNPLLKPALKLILPQLYKYIPSLMRLIGEYKKGNDLILRGATAVLFIHTPESRFGSADANLAYQNGSLMAESLGVSQFYTGFVCTGIDQDKSETINKALGIKGKIHAGMALGMPEFKYPKYIDRKDIKVKRF